MHPDMVFYTDVEAFGVLANQYEIYVFVAAPGDECLDWTHVGIKIEGLSERHVDRPKA
jgi:hypothetical protein